MSLLRNKAVTGVVSEDRVILSEPSTPMTGGLKKGLWRHRENVTLGESPGVTEEEIDMMHVQAK